MYWVMFSVVILLVVGWGSSENGMILYALYFSWAFLVLIYQLVLAIAKKFNMKAITFVLSVIAAKKASPDISVIPQLIVPVSVAYLLLTFIRIFADFVLYTVPVAFRTVFCGGIFVVIYITVFLFIGFFVDK